MRLRVCLFWGGLAATVIAGMWGCGSGHHQQPATGFLRVKVQFPPRGQTAAADGRLIPAGTNSVTVDVTDLQGAELAPRLVIPRPSDAAEASGTIAGLPIGSVRVTADARPSADGSGASLARATSEVNIVAGVTTLELSLASRVTLVEVSPPAVSLQPSQTQQFTATAKDADGTVLVGPQFTWSSDNTAVATVDASGLATAVAVGSANIKATETASGVVGSAPLTVRSPGIGNAGPGILAGDDDNFGYGTGGVPCTCADKRDAGDLGIFDQVCVLTGYSWRYTFNIPQGRTVVEVRLRIRDAFSDYDPSRATVNLDGVSAPNFFVPPTACGPAVIHEAVFRGQAAQFAADGQVDVAFAENGDQIMIDFAELQVKFDDNTLATGSAAALP